DQAKHLAERTGYRHRVEQRNFDAAAFGLGVRFGNVLLSRFPIDDAERLAFEPLSTRQRWLAGNHDGLLALVRTPEGPVAIAGLHLEVRSEEIRWRAAQALAHIRRDRTLPLLILGDLNSTPPGFPQSHPNGGRNAVASLFKAGFRADPAIRPHPKFFTFPSEAPRSVIDWIIAGPSFAISSTKTHPSALSDHLLVSATVTWAAEPGPKGANLSTRQLPRLLKSPG
ncbi:MAG: endonuclease/exonuclease/phosphatase family protein, partial [Acidobacteriota bacterium]